MTKEEIIKRLNELAADGGGEEAHMEADDLLLLFINDSDIKKAFDSIRKWYA